MPADLEMVVCHSDELDAGEVLNDLLAQAESQLEGRAADACLLFVAMDFNHQIILDGILARWPEVQLIGGTTDGELSGSLGFREDSAVLIAFSSPRIRFAAGVGEYESSDIAAACREAAARALTNLGSSPGLCLTVTGNQNVDVSAVLENLENALPANLPVFGGVPGDQWRFEKQYQFAGSNVYENAVPILLMSEEVHFTFGIASGWQALGHVGTVTRGEGRTIYTIDNRPAKDFYEETLGMSITGSTSPSEFPLVTLDQDGQFQFQRAPVGILEDGSGGMMFFGSIPQGARVTIAGADRDSILAGTESSIQQALKQIDNRDQVVGALVFSCSGRRVVLGTRVEEEHEILREQLGSGIPFGGFYGYGEIAPPQSSFHQSGLHNQTIICLIFLSE